MQVVQAGAWLKDDRFERIGRREANHKEREKRQKNRPLRCNKKNPECSGTTIFPKFNFLKFQVHKKKKLTRNGTQV